MATRTAIILDAFEVTIVQPKNRPRAAICRCLVCNSHWPLPFMMKGSDIVLEDDVEAFLRKHAEECLQLSQEAAQADLALCHHLLTKGNECGACKKAFFVSDRCDRCRVRHGSLDTLRPRTEMERCSIARTWLERQQIFCTCA